MDSSPKPVVSRYAISLSHCSQAGLRLHSSIKFHYFFKKQDKVEESVEKCWSNVLEQFKDDDEAPHLFRQLHLAYLQGSLFTLPRSYESLDCSRPWLAYWIAHSLSLLGDRETLLSAEKRACQFLNSCINPHTGGFGGGPGQLAHLATTYATVNAFVSFQSTYALQQLDRENVYRFLMKMKQPDGSFTMHVDGEIDVRGVYCAASVAHICNIQDEKLFENTVDWVLKCQTYEGGFGPCPDNEAHGGYTFCAVASLILLNKFGDIDLPKLLNWLANRQMQYEGGFSGRTNKLVDGCYSFWQGASFPLVHLILSKKCEHKFNFDKIVQLFLTMTIHCFNFRSKSNTV